jgi:hypothetical protein
MNSEERRRKIIEFVEDHPGYLTEQVCKALEQMSRKTFFKELSILREKGEIIVKNKNKRDKELYVDKNNLLITVPKELEQFEKDFLKLVETISIKLKNLNKVSKGNGQSNKTNLTYADIYLASYILLLKILFRIIDSYIFRYLIKWSSSNIKEEDKVQLFIIIFSRISKIILKFREFFRLLTLKNGHPDLYPEINKRLEGAKFLFSTQKFFSTIFLIENQVNKVIDSIWNIDREIWEFIYQEPKHYDFDFDYKKDGWKQLITEFEPYFEEIEKF